MKLPARLKILWIKVLELFYASLNPVSILGHPVYRSIRYVSIFMVILCFWTLMLGVRVGNDGFFIRLCSGLWQDPHNFIVRAGICPKMKQSSSAASKSHFYA